MLNVLNVAQSGLRASQTQVENVMNNLANQNTEGYKRRVVDVTEMEQNDARLTGRGIEVNDVSRITNVYMYQNLITAGSTLSNIDQLNSMLEDVESIFYETETSGFSADLNRYFTSIENLRTSPQNEVYKNDTLNNASVIVSDLQTLYSNIEDLQTTTLTKTKENVNEINSILNEIGNISKKISENTTGNNNDLLDKRDLLEKQLSEFIDVEIVRDDGKYQLKIAGVTAVRFDTNVHEVTLVENYIPQKDVYALKNNDDTTNVSIIGWDNDGDGVIDSKTDLGSGVPISDFQTSFSLNTDLTPDPNVISEVQTLTLSGTAQSTTIKFLGSNVDISSIGIGATASQVANKIDADKVSIMAEWNENYPDRTITNISATGSTITITYEDLDGDVPAIDNTESNGISFTGSLEDDTATNKGKGYVESLTYILNNTESITVTIGETIVDTSGNPVDFDGSGAPIGEVTQTNVIQALVYQINQNQDIGSKVTAYNGNYELAEDGSKILTDDPRHSKYIDPAVVTTANNPGNEDRYLVIESNIDGEKGSFVGELIVNKPIVNPDYIDAVTTPNEPKYITERTLEEKNNTVSKDAVNDIHLEIYDKEISIISGSIKAMLDNIDTESGNNVYNEYKDRLDQFAKTLADLTDSYIENADQSYIYGTDNVQLSFDEDKKTILNLFSGADVKSLTFNKASLLSLTQDKLDYLATLQWRDDIDFDGTGENNESFSEFYQTLRVIVSDNKENASFTYDAQAAVTESIQMAYDKLTKVDSDNEMVELIKFQSAYEANAKMITVVDEMLQTLLNIKR